MKKLFPLIILVLATAVFAQDIDKMPTIVTTGTAEVMVDPDEVTLSLDVTKTSMDLNKAKVDNDVVTEKILAEARNFDIEPKDVKTRWFSVEMKYEYIRKKNERIVDEDGDEVGRKIFKGYEVSKTLIILLKDISKFEAFYSAILNTGLTEVNSVTFTTSKLREHKDQARGMAMRAAREKAWAMAGAVGQSIGKAVKVVEGTVGSRYISGGVLGTNATANISRPTGTTSETVAEFNPGSISVTADVTVSFLLD